MRRTLIPVMMTLSCAFGRLVAGPKNVVVLAGERMSMECRVDGESKVRKWDLLDVDNVTNTVYRHSNERGTGIHPNFPHFGVQVNASGSGILFANSTKMEDAGNYTCISKIDSTIYVKLTAQLIVFESEPKCETNFTGNESLSVGDVIWMRCSVVFKGIWTPTFQWRQYWEAGETGKEGEAATRGVEIAKFSKNNVTSTLSVVISSSANGSFFSCNISFPEVYDSKGSNTIATNLPDFNFTWESNVIQLPYSPGSYDATVSSANTAIDAKTSLSADTQRSREEPPTDQYFGLFMVVAGLSLFLVLIVIIAIAFCIHYKRKVSAKLSTSSSSDPTEKRERPSTTIYDIIPYAVGDNYETINEMEMEDVAADEAKRRATGDDTLGSSCQGYAGLLSTQPMPPAVYSRMDHSHKRPGPFNADYTEPNANETNISDANEDSPEEQSKYITSVNVVTSHPYLELSCDSTEKHLADERTPGYRNIKPTTKEALDAKVIDSSRPNSDDSESPTSYTNANYMYEMSQLPLTQVQVSPTKTSAYTSLISTKDIQRNNSDIATADCAIIEGVANDHRSLPQEV